MTAPVRLQLSRRKGFNLQALSLATNGLPAVNVARPSRWGNRHDWREWREDWRQCAPRHWEATPASMNDWCRDRAAQAFAEDAADGRGPDGLDLLRGKNLACWCPPGSPCHADVLLELANDDATHARAKAGKEG